MSSRCQCPFSGPADTILGSHRDPISSEKGWLDFAVRELSRVAAGKARGQEAVWRSQCKPAWWDCVCPHPWKNPTANPKDSKDTLKNKFECLVQHLRKKEQLPKELEEEIQLWEKGQVAEVFLMTSFSSILGQSSNLHSVLGDACRKMEDTGINVAESILTDLHGCLTACVDKISYIRDLVTQRNTTCDDADNKTSGSGQKRPHNKSDSDDFSPSPSKCLKLSPPPSTSLSSSSASLSPVSASSLSSSSHSLSTSSPSSQLQSVKLIQPVSSMTLNPEQQKLVLKAALQRQLLARNTVTTAATTLPGVQSTCATAQPRSKNLPRQKLTGQRRLRFETNHGSVDAATVVAESTPLTSLSSTPSDYSVPETTEFKEFLDLDFNFWDKILEENSTDVIMNMTSSAKYDSESLGLGSSFQFQSQSSSAQNENTSYTHPDPVLAHTILPTEDLKKSSSSLENYSEAVVDRLVTYEADSDTGVSDDSGISMWPDVRDESLTETEVVSDSDSETYSHTSHRSSLDSDSYSYTDLSSPDLEALLDSI